MEGRVEVLDPGAHVLVAAVSDRAAHQTSGSLLTLHLEV